MSERPAPNSKIISLDDYRFASKQLRVQRYNPHMIASMTLRNGQGEEVIMDPVELIRNGVSAVDFILAHNMSDGAIHDVLKHYYKSVVEYYAMLEHQRSIQKLLQQMSAMSESNPAHYERLAHLANQVDGHRSGVASILFGGAGEAPLGPTFYRSPDFVRYYHEEDQKKRLRVCRAYRRGVLERGLPQKTSRWFANESAISSIVRIFPRRFQSMLRDYVDDPGSIFLTPDEYWFDLQESDSTSANTGP